jgi:hypothetical protein
MQVSLRFRQLIDWLGADLVKLHGRIMIDRSPSGSFILVGPRRIGIDRRKLPAFGR